MFLFVEASPTVLFTSDFLGHRQVRKHSPATQSTSIPLVSQIRLVAHKHDDHVTAPLCPDIIDPLRSLLEGVEIWRQEVGTE